MLFLYINFITQLLPVFSASVNDYIPANYKFSATVYNALSDDRNGKENFIIHPFVAHRFLTLIFQGGVGATANATIRILDVDFKPELLNDYLNAVRQWFDKKSRTKLTLETRVFASDKLNMMQSYRDLITKTHKIEIEKLNFENMKKSTKAINKWARKVSGKEVKLKLKPYDVYKTTKLVMISFARIKTFWRKEFSSRPTAPGTFYKFTHIVTGVPYMRKVEYMSYFENCEYDAQMLELPLAAENTVMVIVLPYEKDGLKKLRIKQSIFERPKFESVKLDLRLPRFSLESHVSFDSLIERMGADEIYESWSNFTKIEKTAGGGEVVPKPIFLKALIQVDESGLQQKTFTDYKVVFDVTSKPIPTPFFVDHPFLFYIKMNDIILFVARVDNPKATII